MVDIGSDDGLSPTRRRAVTWTNTDVLRLLETKFGQISFQVQ